MWLGGKESACYCSRHKRCQFDPWIRKISWRKAWQPTPVLLLGKSHGQRSLAGYSPWGHKESDMTEHTRTLYNFPSRVKSSSTVCQQSHLTLVQYRRRYTPSQNFPFSYSICGSLSGFANHTEMQSERDPSRDTSQGLFPSKPWWINGGLIYALSGTEDSRTSWVSDLWLCYRVNHGAEKVSGDRANT